MDLDFDFEDPLMHYTTFTTQKGGIETEFLVSQYIMDKLDHGKHYTSENEYFVFNPALFAKERVIKTLEQITSDNFSCWYQDQDFTPLSDALPRTITTHYMEIPNYVEDVVMYYSNNIEIIFSNKWHEIHAIGSSDNATISRPLDLFFEEKNWSEEQKFGM